MEREHDQQPREVSPEPAKSRPPARQYRIISGWIDLGRKDVRIGKPDDDVVDNEVLETWVEQTVEDAKSSSRGRVPKHPAKTNDYLG